MLLVGGKNDEACFQDFKMIISTESKIDGQGALLALLLVLLPNLQESRHDEAVATC